MGDFELSDYEVLEDGRVAVEWEVQGARWRTHYSSMEEFDLVLKGQ